MHGKQSAPGTEVPIVHRGHFGCLYPGVHISRRESRGSWADLYRRCPSRSSRGLKSLKWSMFFVQRDASAALTRTLRSISVCGPSRGLFSAIARFCFVGDLLPPGPCGSSPSGRCAGSSPLGSHQPQELPALPPAACEEQAPEMLPLRRALAIDEAGPLAGHALRRIHTFSACSWAGATMVTPTVTKIMCGPSLWDLQADVRSRGRGGGALVVFSFLNFFLRPSPSIEINVNVSNFPPS